jgi:hypothetical protein
MPLPSDHFDGRRYFNPNGANGQPFYKVPRLLITPKTRWPRQVPVQPQRPPAPGVADVNVTFVGHSTFLIQTAAANVLIDPMYAERAGPLPFTPEGIDEPVRDLRAALHNRAVPAEQFRSLEVGESLPV